MTLGVTVALAEAPRSVVAGYVEAITAKAAMGWTWIPGQAAPLAVELRLGAQVVAEAVADGLREDLTRSGIGDGRHAFTLQVPEAMRPRLAELRVFARTADGAAVPLGGVPAEDGLAERLLQLGRGMEMLIGSQRVLHRNVQAVLLAGGQAEAPAGVPAGAAQAALADGIATLELFVTRLEQGMAGLAAQKAPPRQPGRALIGVAAVAATALVLSLWALVHVMPA